MAEKGRQFGLKKGPWTAEEDLLLTKFIEVHGVGRWRTLPQNTGLMRNRKSCRLRWKNYLRPNLNRDNISEDEEDLIIRLHKLLGNRWSLIAGRMPGRTDNQIKNYWNTRLSKKATTKCIRYSSTDKLQQMPNDDASLGSPAVSSFCNEWSIPDANQISERDQQHIASTDNQYIAMENLYSTQKGKVQTSNSTCSDVGRDDATHLLMADMDEDQLVSNPSLFNSSIVSVNLLNDDLRFSAAIQEETTIPKFDSSNAGTISSWNTNGPSYCGPAHYMEDVLTYHEAYSTMLSDQILFPLSQLLDTSEYNQNITKSYDDAVASTTKHAECISDWFDTQWPNSSDIASAFTDCSLMYSENDYILSK